ncbi:MAG TPA: DUF3857 domain-containing protein [Terracidiphilus sp.]|nr:DUF3857 domain-containing protein [Terracidiphilus sp.]
MRISVCLGSTVLFLASVSPLLVRAQFQPPNPDELKMTSDPKAPGADAVYLEIKEIDNDPEHYQLIYERIKVLTDKGKELATVSLPYLVGGFKIHAIEGRTIHPDGTIVPLEGKPEDLMTAKSGTAEIGRKVFTLPSVEVGSVLEYQYQIDYGDNYFSSPLWQIQKRYYVYKAHYEFMPFEQFRAHNVNQGSSSRYLTDAKGRAINSLIWWKNLPSGVDVNTNISGSYSVDVTDIPPIPDEDWMPPIDSVLYKVLFYYEATTSAQAFWEDAAKEWGKEVDHFAEASKPIQEAVASLVAPGDSDLVKAQKLYDAVQGLDNTDYTRRRTASELKQLKLKAAKRAADTWTQKAGSSDDIALLYLAMLRAAGLKAYAARVADRAYRLFDPSYMNIEQLDDTVVILDSGGKEIDLDPGEKMCPFGVLSWRHSDSAGIRESAQGMELTRTPEQEYTQNVTDRVGEVTISGNGSVTGQIRIIMGGQAAMRWRQIAIENDMDEVKKRFDREIQSEVPEGVEAHVDHFLGMSDRDVNLMAIVNVKGELGTSTARRLMLPAFFFETRGNTPFVKQEKRLEPVDMHYGDTLVDEVTYQLPQGMNVEAAPQNTDNLWKGRAIYDVKIKNGAGAITVTRTMARAFTLVKAGEYADLRGFYQKAAASDQQEVVLAEPRAAGGN